MLEFKKLCDAFEEMPPIKRSVLLTEKSVAVLAKLCSIPFMDCDPTNILAGFIIGACISDGKISEKEYLIMYPSLVKIFGDSFDFNSVKAVFQKNGSAEKSVTEYTENMQRLLSLADETLRADIVTLCLCIAAADGKITLREKSYIRRLCA